MLRSFISFFASHMHASCVSSDHKESRLIRHPPTCGGSLLMRLNTTSDRLRLCCLRRTCSTVRCWSSLHSAHRDASACNIRLCRQLDHKASPRKRVPHYDIPDNRIVGASLINRSVPVNTKFSIARIWKFDSHGIRQISVQAQLLGSLLAEVMRACSIRCKLMVLSDHAEVMNRKILLLVAPAGNWRRRNGVYNFKFRHINPPVTNTAHHGIWQAHTSDLPQKLLLTLAFFVFFHIFFYITVLWFIVLRIIILRFQRSFRNSHLLQVLQCPSIKNIFRTSLYYLYSHGL